MRYSVIDDCPCPKPMYPILRKLEKETGCNFESVYRGTDVEALLRAHGKHSQAYLYAHQGTEGIGPANPPGQSTHELCSDGVPYPGPVGRKLHWWQCGLDIDDADVEKVIAAARRHGWVLFRPYGAGSEYHHVNFAKKPAHWRAFYKHVFAPVKKRRVRKHGPTPRVDRPTKLSKHGAEFIAEFEGFSAIPYNDPAGHATIGFGHLIHLGPVTAADNAQWKGFDRARGLILLRKDAERFEQAILDLVDVPLSQNQFDALVSFAYNLGAGALAESTLLKKLNHGNYKAVASQMKRWDKAGGVTLPGLARRRAAEGRLFNRKGK